MNAIETEVGGDASELDAKMTTAPVLQVQLQFLSLGEPDSIMTSTQVLQVQLSTLNKNVSKYPLLSSSKYSWCSLYKNASI